MPSDNADLTRQEYWAEVRSLAAEAVAECPGDEDGQQEWVWETVDGHQWVIYTAYNFDVLKISPNDQYAVEELGASASLTRGDTMVWAVLAFGALYADVMDALDTAREEAEETDLEQYARERHEKIRKGSTMGDLS